ncbi:MAG: BatD family protein [Pseudomonadales bacterium]|nr:BatD family protein [Pseudomonadales bacterium]
MSVPTAAAPRRHGVAARFALCCLAMLYLLLLAPLTLAQAQSTLPGQDTSQVAAFVDSNNIAINDVITLTVRIDAALAEGNTRPQFSDLNREFQQVGGISSRSTYSNINGNIQSWLEYSIRLSPLSTGTLTIPAFRIGGQVTNPIQISVSEVQQNAGEDNDIFLRAEVSKDSLYVQEQLLYTIKIYWAVSFDQGAQLTSPQVADAVVEQLGNDINYQEVVDGIGYNVTERKFVIFPQKSGQLAIPPVYFSASVGRRSSFNTLLRSRGAVREINLASEAHEITVKPQPASFPAGATWLPSSALTLDETWSDTLDSLQVGDALTHNITLRAEGLSSSLLPELRYENQSGLRFYPDQPLREDGIDANGVFGKRLDGVAIVPSQSGDFTLPELRLPWWNTTTDQLEIALLPARSFSVAPLAEDAQTLPPSSLGAPGAQNLNLAGSSAPPLWWISSTVFFAAAWAFTTLLWLRGRQQLLPGGTAALPPSQRKLAPRHTQAPNPTAEASLRTLKAACDGANLHQVRAALLQWGQAASGDSSLRTLEALSLRCNDEAFTTHLHSLDAALYGEGNSRVDCNALYSHAASLHKQGLKPDASGDKYALPPLYKV